MSIDLFMPVRSRQFVDLNDVQAGDPLAFHQTMPGYEPTALLDAPRLAERLGIARLLVKDESQRLGLPAFKMLGASWATARAVQREWTPAVDRLTVGELRQKLRPSNNRRLVAATDGNHGRGVARMAALLGLQCSIFVPSGTAPSRISDIETEGADVTIVNGSYDDAIARSALEANPTTLVISDTSWKGYTATPTDVIIGYSTMFREIDDLLESRREKQPDLVLFQSGVGSFAASGLLHFGRPNRSIRPQLAIVEPTRANCLMRSARAGHLDEAPPPHTSTMAGLNCGLPSLLAWPVVAGAADVYLSIDDVWAHKAMRLLASIGVLSGESGAASLGALLAAADRLEIREALSLGSDTTVLIINTESATDPENYARQVGEQPSEVFASASSRRSATGTNTL